MSADVYTPGPWTRRRAKEATGAEPRFWIDGPRRAKYGEKVGPPVANVFRDVDARLIEAAPDMLAGLRQAVEEMGAWMVERTPTADDIIAMRAKLLALVAKVES